MNRQQKIEHLNNKQVKIKPEQYQAVFNAHLKELGSILGTEIKVSNIDSLLSELKMLNAVTESVDQLSKAIKSIPKTEKTITKTDVKVIEIENKQLPIAIDAIDKLLKELKVNKASQNAIDYTPVRRVIKIGSQFFFDDNPNGQTASSGISRDLTRNTGTTIAVTNSDGSNIGENITLDPSSYGIPSTANSTTTPLNDGQSFTGTAELNNYPDVMLSIKTDVDCDGYSEFSNDGTNWDTSISFNITSGLSESHIQRKGGRYHRLRIENNSGNNQTYLRAYTYYGQYGNRTSQINTTIRDDEDATTVRSLSEELFIAEGRYQNRSIVNKFGANSDIDTGTVPEDIWEGGGTYTGFATSAEVLRVTSSSTADVNTSGTGAWQIRITGLDASYNVIQETVNLNGTSNVTTTNSFIRAHTATIVSAGSGGVNAGTITIRQNVTTANIMLTMIPGRNQTNSSAYTIPAGYTGYMRSLHVAIRGTGIANTPTAVEGQIWTRSFGAPFRSRRPFTVSSSYRLADTIYGGLVFTEKSDIVLRITATSGNDTSVNGGYDLILVAN